MERWLVAVGAGRWQLSGIRAAQDEGCRVFAIDGDKNAAGFSIADRASVVDVRDARAVVREVLQSGIKPAGAISFVSDAGMAAAAVVREEFDLPGPRSELVARLTNKCSQRHAWTAAGLPSPNWFCTRSEAEIESGIARLAPKFIVKPADSAGSRGVTVVGPGEDWRPAFVSALKHSQCSQVIAEDFIEGVEYTVETFTHRGSTAVLAVSEKRKVPGTRGTVAVELATSSHPAVVTDGIATLAKDAIAALGHTDGPGHTEILRKDDGSLWLVETAGRGGGFMVADGLVPRASGFDLNRACARQAVGLEPLPFPELPTQAFVLRFLPARPGNVTALAGFDRVADFANVECEPLVKVGDRVERATTDSARLAYILSWAADRATALARADQVEASIRVDIDEERQRP